MGSDLCEKPPKGWRCTRDAGHDGPCAAVSVDPWAALREADQAYAEGVREWRDKAEAAEQRVASLEATQERRASDPRMCWCCSKAENGEHFVV